MSPGEWLVRGTIWPAVALGLVACLGRKEWILWRWGLVFYLAHAAAAFHYVHGWSHGAAWQHTAGQVQSVVGWESGAGVWVNYGFTLAWAGVAAMGPRLAPGLVRWWRGVFLFMAFQGAVVFAHGYSRWFGLLLFLLAAGAWWRSRPGYCPGWGEAPSDDR